MGFSISNTFKILLFLFYLSVFPELFFPPQENEMQALSQFDVWCLKKWPDKKKKVKRNQSISSWEAVNIWFIFDSYTDSDISIAFIFIKMPAENRRKYWILFEYFHRRLQSASDTVVQWLILCLCDCWLSRKMPYGGGAIKFFPAGHVS